MADQWTNRSVRRLAGKQDPVEVVTRAARDLVIRAIDSGWSGPPFDPLQLADLLKVPLVATDDVRDARTVPVGKSGLRIEFNPNRPAGRVRFSVAHELAHTLFPDCADEIRHRGRHLEGRADQWQLEALCNLAAGEFLMPAGSLRPSDPRMLTIDGVLDLRTRYDVSTEAVLLRLVHLADSRCAMFAASRVEGASRYQVDYAVASSPWRARSFRAQLLPAGSTVAECTAIGFTSRGTEIWPGGERVRVEAVGVPAYPGSAFPRVVGLLIPADGAEKAAPAINYVRGDAAQPRGEGARIVAHVVNDKTPNWGGSGFARALQRHWPAAQDDFRAAAEQSATLLRLGHVHIAQLEQGVAVASMVAQHGYGPAPKPRIRYSALQAALRALSDLASERNATVHMPRIGTGQAGGDWEIVQELIRQTLASAGVSVTVYDLPNVAPKASSQRPLDLGH